MAEIVNVPKLGPTQANLTREKSSLDGPVRSVDKPAIEKVELKGTVVAKRPSFLSRLKDTFVAEDIHDVGDYIIWDIVIPTIRRTIRDVIVGAADRVFLGTTTPSTSSNLYRERGVTYVKRTDYGSASRAKADTRPQNVARPRVNFGIDNIVFDNYEDASSVLERLIDYLDTYGKVSVDDYLDLCGQKQDYTARNWGWLSLSSATIVNVPGGYLIKLPTPVVIK